MASKSRKTIRISRNHDGSFHLVYEGVVGRPLAARCVSSRSVKAAITRWTRQVGAPDRITGQELLTEPRPN